MKAYAVAGLAALTALAEPANATTWCDYDQAQSKITFGYTAWGEPGTGEFTDFAGGWHCGSDEGTQPGQILRVKTASIALGNWFFEFVARSSEWFDSEKHPDLMYRLITLEPTRTGRYLARGELTIRGRTVPIATEISVEHSPGGTVTSGQVAVDRRNFNLGTGLTDAVTDIGHQVTVSFQLLARPAAE